MRFSRDPLQRFAAWLEQQAAISAADLAEIKAHVDSRIDEAVQNAKKAPLPSVEDLHEGVFS